MKIPKQPLLYGAHMSIAGGFEQAIYRGESLGCTAIQFFTKSNRQWLAPKIKQEEAVLFKKVWDNSSIRAVVAHAAYLINIASPDAELSKKSQHALAIEIERCHQLNIPTLVLHPGSAKEGTPSEIAARIANNLDNVLAEAPDTVTVALETMAGQGGTYCYKFEQLAAILEKSKFGDRLSVCFDTCHVFTAGYDLRTEEGYYKTWEQFTQTLGLDRLKVIHLNDSKKGLGSRIDRHTHIGDGSLGLKPFELLFNDERFFKIPKILETPKDSPEDDPRNMAILAGLVSEQTYQKLKKLFE
jgi:deoxyribonuclease-4